MALWRKLALLVVLFTGPALAAGDPRLDGALAGAKKLAAAMAAWDADTVVDLTYSKVAELSGGTDKMRAMIRPVFEQAKKAGGNTTQMVVAVPTPIFPDEGDRLATFIPYHAIVAGNGRTVDRETFYLGISDDKGKTWGYVDGARLDANNIKLFLPRYTGSPPLPESKQAIKDAN